jgi:hypothetical protein
VHLYERRCETLVQAVTRHFSHMQVYFSVPTHVCMYAWYYACMYCIHAYTHMQVPKNLLSRIRRDFICIECASMRAYKDTNAEMHQMLTARGHMLFIDVRKNTPETHTSAQKETVCSQRCSNICENGFLHYFCVCTPEQQTCKNNTQNVGSLSISCA